jgi:hypothetical protein
LGWENINHDTDSVRFCMARKPDGCVCFYIDIEICFKGLIHEVVRVGTSNQQVLEKRLDQKELT